MRPSRADHLAELEIAEYHLARDEKLIEEQKARMRRLAAGGGSVSRDSDSLCRRPYGVCAGGSPS